MAAARLSVTHLESVGGYPKRYSIRATFDARHASFSVFFLDDALDGASFDDDGWAFVDACRKGGYPFVARQLIGVAREAARGRSLDLPRRITAFDTSPAPGTPPAASGAR